MQYSLAGSRILATLRLLRSRTAKQTSMLYFAQLIGIPLGIITSSITTRALGPENYGVFVFYGTLTGFVILFFRFGFASSGKLLVAHENDEDKARNVIGATTIVFLLIGVGYSLSIFGSSFFVDDIFHTSIGSILKRVAALLVLAPFTFMISGIAQGSNNIAILSLLSIGPRLLYTLGVLALLSFFELNVFALILLKAGISITIQLLMIRSLKPSFRELDQNIKKLWAKDKDFGLHVYFAQIADQSTRSLDGILITSFVNTTQLGFYSLANTLISPMVMLSRSLSISLFRSFARMERIPKEVIYVNLLWLASCVAGIVLIGKHIIVLLFSEKFLPVVPLMLALSSVGFLRGMCQPYNMFLVARGEKRAAHIAIATSLVNLAGNCSLIPSYGAMGACVASGISMLFWYVLYVRLYRKVASDVDGKP